MDNLTQPLKWHGGKHYLAQHIIDLMPPHLHYVEPYFGGGSVLLQKDPEGISEVVNDLNRGLTNFWRVLQSPELFYRFERLNGAMPFSEEEWKRAQAICDMAAFDAHSDQGKVRLAADFFVACRQSRAGMFKDFSTLTRNRVRRGMNAEVSAWLNCIEGLPEVHARLKRVVILNRDALDVIVQQDGPKTLFYCDPPYVHETRSSKNVYAHEMTDKQHAQLLELLGLITGKFLLSGYPSEMYDRAAVQYGWKCHQFEIDNKAAGGETKRKMIECVWMNY